MHLHTCVTRKLYLSTKQTDGPAHLHETPSDRRDGAAVDDILAPGDRCCAMRGEEGDQLGDLCGQPGRPSGMPPSDFINCSRAVFASVPELAASRSISAVAAVVCMKPGATLTTRMPLGPTSFERPLL